METTHLTPELLDAFGDGDLPPPVLALQLFRHLLATCDDCQGAMEEWLGRHRGLAGNPLFRELVAGRSEPAEDPREARRLRRQLQELLRTPAGERPDRVEGATKRFRSPRLAEMLIGESRGRIFDDPAAAFDLATLARRIAARSAEPLDGLRVQARAAIHQGNALRVATRFRDAEPFFAEARHLLHGGEVLDAEVYAELDEHEGVLRRELAEFPEALRLLRRAAFARRVVRDDTAAARLALSVATVHAYAGEPERAIEELSGALEEVDRTGDDRLRLSARHNLGVYLCDAGDVAGARRVADGARELYERFAKDRTIQLRRRWLEGLIDRGSGHFDRAEEHFHTVIAGFVELGIGYDAALTALDLAQLHLETGDTAKLESVAGHLPAILEAQDFHREATAALLLLQTSLRQEVVTHTLLQRVRRHLHRTGPDTA